MERTKGLLNARGDHSSLPPLLTPVLFRFSPHRRMLWVLALDPVARASRAVRRAEPLRHDALEAKLTSMAESHLAVVLLDVLVEAQAGCSLGHHRGERRLAHLQRIARESTAGLGPLVLAQVSSMKTNQSGAKCASANEPPNLTISLRGSREGCTASEEAIASAGYRPCF
jgi:hypothetical protein